MLLLLSSGAAMTVAFVLVFFIHSSRCLSLHCFLRIALARRLAQELTRFVVTKKDTPDEIQKVNVERHRLVHSIVAQKEAVAEKAVENVAHVFKGLHSTLFHGGGGQTSDPQSDEEGVVAEVFHRSVSWCC
jgi:hypothetical protein